MYRCKMNSAKKNNEITNILTLQSYLKNNRKRYYFVQFNLI